MPINRIQIVFGIITYFQVFVDSEMRNLIQTKFLNHYEQ